MALNFPGSPTPNQVYTDTTTKLSWVWNSVLGAWESAEQPPVIVSDLQPDTTATGKLWYRPSTNVLKVYNGSEWTEAKSVFGVDYSSTAPTLRPDGSDLQNGDQWYDFDDNKLYIYDAGTWVDIAPNLGSPSFAAGTSANPGLFVTGDSDTGFYSPGANQLGIATGGNGRIIIGSSGQVGIGGTPSSGIFFGVYSTVTGGTLNQVIENKATNGSVKLSFNRGIDGAQGQAAITYIPGTEFSIGLESNDITTPFIINTSNSTERLRLGPDGTLTVGSSPANAKLSVSGSAPTNSIIVDSSGRTGIGASPAFKLDVVSTTGINTIRSFSSASTDSRFVAKNSSSETIFGSDNNGSYITQASNLPFRVLTNNTENFRILSDGSVSIKTDGVTDAKLHVSGTKTSNIVHFEAGTGFYDGIYLQTQTLTGQSGGVKWVPNTTPSSGTTQFTTNFASNTSGGTVKHNVRIEGDLFVTGSVSDSTGSYLTSSNYTTYTVTKTGTGASGTWPISITGNAATATNATNATTVPWTGISGKPTTLSGYGITDAVNTNSPSLSGTPTAPTATVNTNTTQVATTAFVISQIANDAPTKTGGGATGNWGINITGSSASCTGNASTATTASLATDVVGDANRILFNSALNDTTTSSNLTFNGTNLGVGGGITAGGTIGGNVVNSTTTGSIGTNLTVGNNISAAGTITGNTLVVGPNAITGAELSLTGSYAQTTTVVPALNIDCSTGNYFTKTINGNSTFTVSNVPSSGNTYSFTLEITHTSGTITWFSGINWVNGITPSISTGKVHLFCFVTRNGGTTWRGLVLPNFNN